MMGIMNELRVLFLCTGNSCNSRMAEGWLRLDRFESCSPGARSAGRVHPLAIRPMAEVYMDISAHRSKSLDEIAELTFDLPATVCDDARADCPIFARAERREHWGFDDQAQAPCSDEGKLAVRRRIRVQIGSLIRRFLIPSSPEMKG
jgi:arsenate reductase